MSNLTSTLAAVVVLAAALAGCTAPDLDEAACNEVAAYVRGERPASPARRHGRTRSHD